MRLPFVRSRAVRDESGMALLVAVMMLLLISAIGVAAIDHSGTASQTAGHSRRSTVTFYAADAGVQFGRTRVFQNPPNLSPFTITMDDGTTARTGRRTDGGPVTITPPDTGAPPEGFSINVGSGTGFVSENTLFSITAQAGSSTAELETRVAQTRGGYGSYR
jgi:hypothetical protein